MIIKKTGLLLILIFSIGLILRIIAANNVDISPDEMVYSVIPLNIISAGRLGTVEQSPLYFYLTDLGYKLSGGITPLSTRLPSIIFGSFAVFVIYLLAVEIFKKKEVGLIAAFLFAVSGYAIRYNTQMYMAEFFFILLSLLFFVRSWEGKEYNLYLSALAFGLAVLIKNTAVLFIPAYILVWFWYNRQPSKKQLISVGIACLIFLSALIPVFAYNYLAYQEKGITDYYFSAMLGIGKSVHGGMENKSWEFTRLIIVFNEKVKQLFTLDAPLFILGLIGIYFSFKRDKIKTGFLILTAIPLLIYVGGVTAKPPHYLWLPILFSFLAANSLDYAKEKINKKHFLLAILSIILIINLGLYWKEITEKSSILSLRSYVDEKIPDNAIVILDPRIYRGIHAWVFNDKHYLEGTYFDKFNTFLTQLKETKNNIPFYYVECGKETTCAWSTEDYQRVYNYSEALTTYFKTSASLMTTISGEERIKGKQHHFPVYQGFISAPFSVYPIIDQTHQFWFYPVGWKSDQELIDDYQPKGWGIIINGLGFIILYLELILAVVSLGLVVYWTTISREKG